MTNRILSQHGNVIAADFRKKASLDITVTLTTETLYIDDHIILTRTTGSIGGKPAMCLHFLANLATGQITTL